MITFSDELFEIDKSTEYDLSIQLRLDGFSFSVQAPSDGKVVFFRHFPFHLSSTTFLLRKIREITAEEPALQLNYRTVTVSLASPVCTLIPAPFFEAARPGLLLLHDTPATQTEEPLFGMMKNLDACFCFRAPARLVSYLRQTYQGCRIFHELMPQISHSTETEPGRKKLLLNLHPGYFHLFISEGGRARLLNTFSFSNYDDLLYFLLSAAQAEEVGRERDTLLVSGNLEIDTPLHRMLGHYFPKTGLLHPIGGLSYLPEAVTGKAHLFFNLLNPAE